MSKLLLSFEKSVRLISYILISQGLSFLDTSLCKYPNSASSLRAQREHNMERIQAAASAPGFGLKIALVLVSQCFHLRGAHCSHLQESSCEICVVIHITLKIGNLRTSHSLKEWVYQNNNKMIGGRGIIDWIETL